MIEKFKALQEKYAEISDINSALALLRWDQQTYMPPMGVAQRAKASGALEGIIHKKFVSDEMGALINDLYDWSLGLNPDSFEADYLRVIKKDYDKDKKLPLDFVKEFSESVSLAMKVWSEAKEKNEFSLFAPHLEKLTELNKKKARFLGFEESPYDALLDLYEPGMKKSDLDPLFKELSKGLSPLIKGIMANQDKMSNDLVKGSFGEESQFLLLNQVASDIGYDFEKGRQDKSAHPFTIGVGRSDVRITTRVHSDYFPAGLYATIHECGHAMYEQNIDPDFERTPLSGGASTGIHESQSRLWENIIGRSRPFAKWIMPKLKEFFPSMFEKASPEDFYRAVNRAQLSVTRVEADEVTYNLHIMLRFEIENLLLNGELKVKDAPAFWNEKMLDYFGVRPSSDAEGILQDIHWSMGTMGYFPTYALGNLISAQIRYKMKEDLNMDREIENGNFSAISDWLRKKIHIHGRKYEPHILLEKSLSLKLSAEPFLDYVNGKYSDLYGLKIKFKKSND